VRGRFVLGSDVPGSASRRRPPWKKANARRVVFSSVIMRLHSADYIINNGDWRKSSGWTSYIEALEESLRAAARGGAKAVVPPRIDIEFPPAALKED